MPNVKFFLRSNNDLSCTHVLYIRVSYNNSTAEMSIREKIDPKFWFQTEQRAKTPSKPQTTYINYTVESLTYKIKAMFLEKDFRHATAKQILNSAFQSEESEPRISEIIEKYINAQKTEVKEKTITNHEIKQKNFLAFEESVNMIFVPSNFTPVYANRFIEWFKSTKNTKKNTSAVRTALFPKTAMQWALNEGIIENFAIINYTAKKDKRKKAAFITRKEFQTLFTYTCKEPSHDRIKDLFLFQCLTGLSYIDLWSWKLELEDQQYFITGNRNKNGNAFRVPIDELAISLIQKYDGKLPVYSNIVYNRILKFVAKEVGIETYLTTHIGRKTFATLRSGIGWSTESISLMLGHQSIRTTEDYYIGHSFERIETELSKMRSTSNKNG